MKKISEHLGVLIVALAGIVLLLSCIAFFRAPIGNFYDNIIFKLTNVGDKVINSIDYTDGDNDGEDGGGETDDPADEPVDLTLFYTYNASGEAYRIGLTNAFANAVNNNVDYVVDGETLWTAGSALPNPGATYEGKPVNSYAYTFAYNFANVTALDLSEWDTSKVSSMDGMFENCFGLQTLKVDGWNTANVTTMNSMFGGCQSLTALNLSHFNTANVTDMQSMFVCCMSLETLNVSNFNTANVDNMSGMFSECSSLTTLDLSSFDTSSVTNTGSMFKDCDALNSILARTAADKATFEASDSFPGCTVTVK